MTITTIMTDTGVQPQTSTDLRAALIALVTASNPGYTADLPASLIEDIASTDVGAMIMCDQAYVDLVNSVTPLAANEYLLNQLAQIYGVNQYAATNTSVYVTFSGTVGFQIPVGFTVSDGTYQYVVQNATVIPSGGVTAGVYCLAVLSGTWAVPVGTVTTLVTSTPSTITLSCNNLVAGVPAAGAETVELFRSQVLQAGQVTAQGTGQFLRTLLNNVPGVQPRLVSMRQTGTAWEIICGGGDPYQVANAIWTALFDTSNLVGSTLSVTAITKANPGVITTDKTHGFSTGQVINITGIVGMTALNNVPLTITVLTNYTFSIGVNTTSYTTYVSGGVITPNLRNNLIAINNYPDTYLIPFVTPLQQVVTLSVLWNTNSVNYVAAESVSQLAQPALVDYINGIYAGQPINVLDMQNVFQEAVAPIVPIQLLTKLQFTVTIDGNIVTPVAGTGIVNGDPESYLYVTSAGVTINQG